jgi:phosphate transport system substrate-binding protein
MRVSRARAALVSVIVAGVLALVPSITACGSSGSGGGSNPSSSARPGSASNVVLGAGATFPYPLYSAWASAYQSATGEKVNYQAVGSSAGIEQIKNRIVWFGASDAPLTAGELKRDGLFQFPACIGGVSVIYNLPGVSKLRLDGPTLADIFMGKITKWNDTAIADQNPGVTLPDTAISVVHRADGSGTTWIFSSYLSAVSTAWKSDFGAGQTISWPAGVGGKGSDGVAQQVKTVPGGIGYVEYAYAKQGQIAAATLKNADGKWVQSSLDGFSAAAKQADWANAPGLYLALVNLPGAYSYPIVGASFILVHTDTAEAAEVQSVLKFYDWSFKNGRQKATSLDYVYLPQSTVDLIEGMWRTDLTSNGKRVWPAGS